jgi:hypothetical protein
VALLLAAAAAAGTPEAFTLLTASEAGLYNSDLMRFLHANRYPLRSKTL